MIPLGVCIGTLDNLENAASVGFDFVELGFAWLNGLEEREFERVAERVKAAGIPVRSMNGMVRSTLKLCGEQVDWDEVEAYLDSGVRRAARLGVKVVVFGSGAARRVPENFPHETAWRQLARFLERANVHAGKAGMLLAMEPLRRRECNILNLVSEGVLISSLLQLPHVGVLGDVFHMSQCAEPLEVFAHAGRLLHHVHVSCACVDAASQETSRRFPGMQDRGEMAQLFEVLKRCGYSGGVSVEAGCHDFLDDGKAAVEVLRAARA